MKTVQVQMICALGLSSAQWAHKKVRFFFFPNHILDVIYKNRAENQLGIYCTEAVDVLNGKRTLLARR